MPIPTLSQYVALSKALSTILPLQDLPLVVTDSSFGQQWGNLLTLGTLHLTPQDSPLLHDFWTYINTTYPLLVQGNSSLLQIQAHPSSQEAWTYIDEHLQERTWAMIDFTDSLNFKTYPTTNGSQNVSDASFRYKIRMNFTTVPNTNEITNYVAIGLDTKYQMYYLSGYLTLQRTLNEFAASRYPNCTIQDSSIWSMPMPTAAYSQNPFFLQVGYLLGLTLVMAFLYPTSRLIKLIVEEKETRMKETLFILGVRGWVHWLSWWITSLVVFLFITWTVTVTLTATVLQYSNRRYIFVLIGLFSTSTIGFCFTVASCFSRAKLAAILGPMTLFATILPKFIFFGFNQYEATTGNTFDTSCPIQWQHNS